MMVNNKQLQYFYIIKINKQCLQSIFIFDVWISCYKLFCFLSLTLIDVRNNYRAEATSSVIDITAVAFEIETREELNRVKTNLIYFYYNAVQGMHTVQGRGADDTRHSPHEPVDGVAQVLRESLQLDGFPSSSQWTKQYHRD